MRPAVYAKPKRLPNKKFKYTKEELNQMMQLGIIHPSCGNWASPLHLVSKGNGAWRTCGDYRALNAIVAFEGFLASRSPMWGLKGILW